MNMLKIKYVVKLFCLCLLVALCFCAQITSAQQSDETKRGIELYNQGNDKEAIELLKAATKKNKDDIEAWHHLGLAYARTGKTKDAIEVFEKTIERVLNDLESQFDKKDKDKNHSFLSFLAERNKDFFLIIKIIDKRIEIDSTLPPKRIDRWRRLQASFIPFIEMGNENTDSSKRRVYSQYEVTTKAKITENPNPEMSVSAIVKLLVVLEADGTVGRIAPIGLKLLPISFPSAFMDSKEIYSDSCVNTARQIKFVPAERNGEKVSQLVFIQCPHR